MPAASEPGQRDAPQLPVTWRPLGPRIAAVMAAVAVLVVITLLWVGFEDRNRESVNTLQRLTVIGLLLLGGSCLHALARSRVTAREDELVVVNGYRRRRFEWAQIVGVQLRPGDPWAIIDLADGTTVPAMGIQSSDGARARQAVVQLRALSAQGRG